MKSFFSKVVRGILSFHVFLITVPIAQFAFHQSFLTSLFIGIGVSVATSFFLKWRKEEKKRKQNQLTRQEFTYIKNSLKEAHQKRKRLNRSLLHARSLSTLKEIGTLQQYVSKVFRVVEHEPKRFFQANHFFFYQLDSIVELSDKFTFLSAHSLKDATTRQSLKATEDMLRKLTIAVEKELNIILAHDIDEMNVELEMAKHSIRLQTNRNDKEGRL